MAKDMSVAYVSQYSPCIFANLSVTKIAELVEKDEVVWAEYVGEDEIQDAYDTGTDMTGILPMSEIEDNIDIIRGEYAKDYFAVSGNGIKIGQIENYVPDDTEITKEDGFQNLTNAHADNVYNIMRTLASDATFYATGAESSILNTFSRIEWLLSQGVNIINMSAGYGGFANGYFAFDKWIDHIAYNHDVHFVISAGNEGSYGVGSPAMGYNIITVGAVENEYPYNRIEYYEYKNEGGQVKIIEHASSYNSLGQSLSEHRTLKPDMMAPGRYTSCWGTSFSAPLVTATIALMCEYYPSLKTKQHIVKAILAATTAKQVTQAHYVTGTEEFKKNGAGLVDAYSVLRAIYKRHFSSSTGALINVGDKKTYSMSVTSNDTCMRIAVAHANRICREFSS